MSAIRNYAVVTASYMSFTLTDGAIRMLVLLHFYALGLPQSIMVIFSRIFSAVSSTTARCCAISFALYDLARLVASHWAVCRRDL